MNMAPQTFNAIIKAVSEQPASQRPNHLFFLWFTLEQTTKIGTISLVGTSSISWRSDVTFKEMSEFGVDVIGAWDVLLMWSDDGSNDKQPSQQQINAELKRKSKKLANGPQPIQNEAMFGRDGNMIDALDFVPSKVN